MAAPSESDDLLLFAPVAQRRVQARGWSAEAQRAFIAALAQCGVVRAAARSVGKTARSAYQLRARPDAAGFAAAWGAALDRGQQQAHTLALDRWVSGAEVPVIRRGRIIGTVLRHDNRLVMAALGAWRHEIGPNRDRAAWQALRARAWPEGEGEPHPDFAPPPEPAVTPASAAAPARSPRAPLRRGAGPGAGSGAGVRVQKAASRSANPGQKRADRGPKLRIL